MGATNFYMGSLRYDPTGRKRKTTALSKKKVRKEFIPLRRSEPHWRAEEAKKHKEMYPSMMEEAIKNGTFNSLGDGKGTKKESMKYTGTLIKGIATMHKSNAVPVINQQQATDIARMRRG